MIRRENGDARSGTESTLLVRAAIHSVIDKIGPNAAIVQESVALTRSTIARNLLSALLCTNQELQQLPLGLFYLLGKTRVSLQAVIASGLFPGAQLNHPGTDGLGGILSMAGIDAERAAVSGKFFDVEQGQPVGSKNSLDGKK